MAHESIEFFNRPDWRFTKFLLTSFGAWPFQALRLRKILRSVIFILIVSILIPEILSLVVVRKNSSFIVECIPILSLHILSFTNMLQCFINTDKIGHLLVRIQKDWQCGFSPCEVNMLQSYNRQNRIKVHTYIYFIYCGTVVYMSPPMIPKILDLIVPLNKSRPKVAAFHAEYFVNTETHEIPILIHAYIIAPIISTMVVAFDALYANCVHHGCSMFAIVGYRLKNISNNKNMENVQKNVRADENIHTYHTLTDCIAKHEEVLEYSRLLESTYASCMMAIVAINTFAMSITGLQTILKLNEPIEVLRFGIFIVAQVIHLSFLSWPSQKLMDRSEQILQSTYEGEWYTFPPKLRRHHFFIMMMGQRPCKLTAGKFYTMSLQSFGNVVKTSMSYCTVLLSMQ